MDGQADDDSNFIMFMFIWHSETYPEKRKFIRYFEDTINIYNCSDSFLPQFMFKKYGGEIRDGEEMTSLFPGKTISVTTRNGQYKTRSVVLTVGPWATKVLPLIGIHVPLQVNEFPCLVPLHV